MTADTGESEARRDIPSDTFAARLVLVRHHAGRLSIEQAAKKCGLNSGNWQRWEDGARPRDRIEVSQTISEALGIDLDWLMFGGPLLGARGRQAKQTETDTVRYGSLARPAGPSGVRPAETRPTRREDRSGPPSPSVVGRRAVLARSAR